MRAVWKFPLALTDEQWIKMPRKAEPVLVAEQHGRLCLWAAVDAVWSSVQRRIIITGTGRPVPDGLVHVGSVVTEGGALVWHVWDGGEE